MPTLALVSGAVALATGIAKYALDAYSAKHSPPSVNVSIGSESVQVPSSYTPEQVAALVAVLKENATTGSTRK